MKDRFSRLAPIVLVLIQILIGGAAHLACSSEQAVARSQVEPGVKMQIFSRDEIGNLDKQVKIPRSSTMKIVAQKSPVKDTQGWLRVALGTAPDHWYECDVTALAQNGDADLMCRRLNVDAGVPETFTMAAVPCWKSPHPHFLTAGPPAMGFAYPTPDPRDSYIGTIVDGDAGSLNNLLVSHPDGDGGLEITILPNADMMTDLWTFPMWIPHVLYPVDADSAAIISSSCDLVGYFDGGAP